MQIVDGIAEGQVSVSIYKNGEFTGLRNVFSASESGVKKDYDTQAKEIVTFIPGDVISAHVETSDDVSWDDVITMAKIELK